MFGSRAIILFAAAHCHSGRRAQEARRCPTQKDFGLIRASPTKGDVALPIKQNPRREVEGPSLKEDRLPARARRNGVVNSTRVPCVGSNGGDRKSTRLNSSHLVISYAVFCLKKKKK